MKNKVKLTESIQSKSVEPACAEFPSNEVRNSAKVLGQKKNSTLTGLLSNQGYKWAPAICQGSLTSHPGESSDAPSRFRNRNELPLDGWATLLDYKLVKCLKNVCEITILPHCKRACLKRVA